MSLTGYKFDLHILMKKIIQTFFSCKRNTMKSFRHLIEHFRLATERLEIGIIREKKQYENPRISSAFCALNRYAA